MCLLLNSCWSTRARKFKTKKNVLNMSILKGRIRSLCLRMLWMSWKITQWVTTPMLWSGSNSVRVNRLFLVMRSLLLKRSSQLFPILCPILVLRIASCLEIKSLNHNRNLTNLSNSQNFQIHNSIVSSLKPMINLSLWVSWKIVSNSIRSPLNSVEMQLKFSENRV